MNANIYVLVIQILFCISQLKMDEESETFLAKITNVLVIMQYLCGIDVAVKELLNCRLSCLQLVLTIMVAAAAAVVDSYLQDGDLLKDIS